MKKVLGGRCPVVSGRTRALPFRPLATNHRPLSTTYPSCPVCRRHAPNKARKSWRVAAHGEFTRKRGFSTRQISAFGAWTKLPILPPPCMPNKNAKKLSCWHARVFGSENAVVPMCANVRQWHAWEEFGTHVGHFGTRWSRAGYFPAWHWLFTSPVRSRRMARTLCKFVISRSLPISIMEKAPCRTGF